MSLLEKDLPENISHQTQAGDSMLRLTTLTQT